MSEEATHQEEEEDIEEEEGAMEEEGEVMADLLPLDSPPAGPQRTRFDLTIIGEEESIAEEMSPPSQTTSHRSQITLSMY